MTKLKGKPSVTFDNFETSLSLHEHFDYKVISPEKGRKKGAKKHKKESMEV